MKKLRLGTAAPAFFAGAALLSLAVVSTPAGAGHDPGECIKCELSSNAEACRRCVDKPDATTPAVVPPACKAAAETCKPRMGECGNLGNPIQFLDCITEEDTCAAAVKPCKAEP